jgi:hypothetical protein
MAQANEAKITFRLAEQEIRFLRIVGGHVQAKQGSPFCSQADALREALRIAAEIIANKRV